MKRNYWMSLASAAAAAFWLCSPSSVEAQKLYDTGASDTEIRIGNTMPYSGPVSAYGIIGKTLTAYFKMVNENGGINGRRVSFTSYDDAYNPTKTVEQVRKLVESDEVLVTFYQLGTAPNLAVQKYLNARKVPQLFVATGASRFSDPGNFHWTMGWPPNYRAEARIYASYVLRNYPGKKVGVLYQNDDFGKDYLLGLRDIFGEKYRDIVLAEASYETSAPTVDSQVVAIKTSNVDIFVNVATPKFAAQAIKKIAELNWSPVQFLTNAAASVGATLRPAGLENSKGILSAHYLKDPTDTQWDSDKTMMEWRAFMAKYLPEADRSDAEPLKGYGAALGITRVLLQAGDNLTRENIMKQAANLDMEIGVYLPGIRIKTSQEDYSPIDQLQMMRFNGERWELFGSVMGGD